MDTNWILAFRLWFVSAVLFAIAVLCYVRYAHILQFDPVFVSWAIFIFSIVLSLPVLIVYLLTLSIIHKSYSSHYKKLKGLLLLNAILAAIYTMGMAITLQNEQEEATTLRYVFVFITLFASSAGSLLINQSLLQQYFLEVVQEETAE